MAYYAPPPSRSGRRMQIVREPCDINGPLAENSLWPYEVQIFPSAARPDYAAPFEFFTVTTVGVVDTFVTVLSIDPGSDQEGRAIEWGSNETNAAGTVILPGVDLVWRFAVGNDPTTGSPMVNFAAKIGQWSAVASPVVIPLKLERNKFTLLQVLLPAAGGAPRTVRAICRGWMAPFIGGGTFASGAGRS